MHVATTSLPPMPHPPLLDTKLFHLLQIWQRQLSSSNQESWNWQSHPWHSIYQPINILSVYQGDHHFPHPPKLSLSWLHHLCQLWGPLMFLIKPWIPISDKPLCISCHSSYKKLLVIVINSLPKGHYIIQASNVIVYRWIIGWNPITT